VIYQFGRDYTKRAQGGNSCAHNRATHAPWRPYCSLHTVRETHSEGAATPAPLEQAVVCGGENAETRLDLEGCAVGVCADDEGRCV